MIEQTISSFFQKDHDRIDRIFDEFQSLKSSNSGEAAKKFNQFKKGLERHMKWEEELLFPLFESKTGMKKQGPTEAIRREHNEIKKMMKNLEQTNEGAPLIAVLTQHNYKEESILYPTIDRLVTAEERKSILGKISSEIHGGGSCCGVHSH